MDWDPLTIEKKFEELAYLTDQISRINSPYEVDLGPAFDNLNNFSTEVRGWEILQWDDESCRSCLSHLSFHREMIHGIIGEARDLLMENRRDELKTLVQYHKDFVRWYSKLEKEIACRDRSE